MFGGMCKNLYRYAFSFMTSYAWKMTLLLVREIRNWVRENSVKNVITDRSKAEVLLWFIFILVIFINVDYSMTL